jgi:hypothetical protein
MFVAALQARGSYSIIMRCHVLPVYAVMQASVPVILKSCAKEGFGFCRLLLSYLQSLGVQLVLQVNIGQPKLSV